MTDPIGTAQERELIERLWHLHRRGLSYASDTPAVNLLLANLSEGIEQAADALQSRIAEGEAMREAGQRVLDGLNARIDAADPAAVPIFDGIAELHAALQRRPT